MVESGRHCEELTVCEVFLENSRETPDPERMCENLCLRRSGQQSPTTECDGACGRKIEPLTAGCWDGEKGEDGVDVVQGKACRRRPDQEGS
jgi:hypothetical protein